MSDDMLETIFAKQRALQIESFGYDPAAMDGDERTTFITWNVLAATDELHEALAEVGWKPWASSRHVNEEAFKNELVDVLHFFVNLCLTAGMSADELYLRYTNKRKKNAERQAAGYDGISGKCGTCKRALDDEHVTMPARITYDEGKTYIYFCSAECAVSAVVES